MPEATLLAFANHGEIGPMLTADGGNADEVLARFARAGVDVSALAADLQADGAKSFVASWNELMAGITSKCEALRKAR
jgi:transaldolase